MKAAVCKMIKTSRAYVKVVFVIVIFFAFIETCLTMGVHA